MVSIMQENKFYSKYLKYKNKYLNLKKSMKGGLIAITNSKNFSNCPENSIYIPEFCNNEGFSCLKKDGFCYDTNNNKGDKYISESIVNKIFSTVGKAVIIKLSSVTGKKFVVPISKALMPGAQSTIFTLTDFSNNPIDKLLRLTNSSDVTEKFQNFLNTNPDFEDVKKYFPKINSRYDSFKGMELQYELRNIKQINTLFDYGRFKIELNNKSDGFLLEDVNPVGTYIPSPPGKRITNKTGTYSIIENCNGGDLFDRVETNNYKNINNLQAIIKNILIGIKGIHDLGYVHVDLKPENIGMFYSLTETLPNFVTEIDRHSEIRILDFGHANYEGSIGVAGSLSYMSPDMESAYYSRTKKVISKPDDMFSMGILMYELIHKFVPFKGEIIEHSNTPMIEDDKISLSVGFSRDPGDDIFIITYKNDKKTGRFKISWFEDNIFTITNFNIIRVESTIYSCDKYIVIIEDEKVRTYDVTIDPFKELNLNSEVIDLLEGLLKLDEDERMTVDQALDSSFIKNRKETSEDKKSFEEETYEIIKLEPQFKNKSTEDKDSDSTLPPSKKLKFAPKKK